MRGQELHLFDRPGDGIPGDLIAAADLGGSPAHLVSDHRAEAGDAIPDLPAQHLVGESALVLLTSPELVDDAREQRLRGEHPQRLIGRPARLPAVTADPGTHRAGAAERVHRGARQFAQRRRVPVAQQVGQHVAQRVDIDRSAVGVRDPRHVDGAGTGTRRDREVEVEQGVERLPLAGAAEQRGGQPLAQLLALQQVERAQHLSGVDRLAGADGDVVAAQRRDELQQVAGQSVLLVVGYRRH